MPARALKLLENRKHPRNPRIWLSPYLYVLIDKGTLKLNINNPRATQYEWFLLYTIIYLWKEQVILGHSSIRTTMDIYGHASNEMQIGTINKIDTIIFVIIRL